VRIDTRVETDAAAEIGNGTEIEVLHDAMQEETTTIDHPGETEICLMIEEVEADDAVIGVMAGLEVEVTWIARRAQVLHQRRGSQHQT
jgi:hypothetical protein